jgi:hypothetical protein
MVISYYLYDFIIFGNEPGLGKVKNNGTRLAPSSLLNKYINDTGCHKE